MSFFLHECGGDDNDDNDDDDDDDRNKTENFLYGDGFFSNLVHTLCRFALDVLTLCVSLAYGWRMAFLSNLTATIWFFPVLYVTYGMSKYIFIERLQRV